jgi:hypothetical protein
MNALTKFSHEAARRYLQSAVFIDDHIFDQETGRPEVHVEEFPTRKPILKRASRPAAPPNGGNSVKQMDVPDLPFHPKDLVGSFAREGIICALYEPKKGFETHSDSEIFRICERPDIIILDWDFDGDHGLNALDLVAALVTQSSEEFPHHTRLIAIYTSDPSLIGVANQLADRLEKEGLPAIPEGAQCRLRSGASRITVLGKPRERFGEEEQKFTVKESGLARKLIDEFVGMNSGILPAYALHGLAAIRRNSKRILDHFHGDLDGAFLLHRDLVVSSGEAFDQLAELLAEEIRAIVEDARISASQAKKIATSALRSEHVSEADKKLIADLKAAKAKTVIKKIPVNGVPPSGHLKLAALFCSRTQYSVAPRQLGFGTILRYRTKWARKDVPWQYAVCLVPTCDSIRLDKLSKVRFPFWTIDIEKFSSDLKRNGMVLPQDGFDYLSLSAGGKAGERLWTDSFDVDPSSKTVVARRTAGHHRYSGSERMIEWVGQLKALHAHRIAHEITQSLSRVGVNEAEWLRVLCDRNG